MAWRGSRARGVFRAPACIAFSSERHRLRSPVAPVRQALVRMLTWPIISAGKSKRPTFTAKAIANYGRDCALPGFARALTRHPELLTEWSVEERDGSVASHHAGPNPVAIVVHLYYEDTWPDIAGALQRLTVPFDLIITTVPGRDRLIKAVRRAFPDADVEAMENRARDVRPFLTLLERGRLDRYRYVCKVHGEKSSDGGRKSHMGALWRRRLLFDLLAAPNLARAVVDTFEDDPTIGMISPRGFRLPNATYSEDLCWSVNRPMVLELAQKMGVPADQFRLDFFGGTMFWVRPEALQPLRDLRLASAFPEEKGLLDGGLEHAVERLFGAAVVAAGYRLADTGGFSEVADSERGAASRYKKHVDRKRE